MECSCIKGLFRFNITTHNSEYFIYEDLSDWMTEEYYIIPEKYTIEILPPGYSEFKSLDVYTNRVNMITPTDLGVNSFLLSDGIYCVRVTNCGTTYKRNIAITEKLECGNKKLLLQAISTKKQLDYDLVNKLNMMIDSIKIYASRDMPIEAQKLYTYVKNELDRLNCIC